MSKELEAIVKKERLPRKVLRKAAEPFAELYHTFRDDLACGEVFRGNTGKRLGTRIAEAGKRTGKAALGFFSPMPFYIMLHEAMHSAVYKIAGIDINYFSIREIAGGGLLQKIFPWISTNLDEFGISQHVIGKIMTASQPGALAKVSSLAFPYALTPLGICLMRKGKRTKSLFTEGTGLLIALAPFKGAFGDFCAITQQITGAENMALNIAGGTAMAVAVYAGSKYAADGLEAIAGKLKKKERKEGLLRGKLLAAKYYAALAASAVLLGYLGQPNMPIKHSIAVSAKNNKMLCNLCNSGKYQEVLDTGLGGRPEYGEVFMLAYANLVDQGKMEEEDAVSKLSGTHRDRFYIYLGLNLVRQEKYDEALAAVSKMPDTPENLEDRNWGKRVIHYTYGRDFWIKGRNISRGANPGRAREYFEKARELYMKALSFETQKDPTLLKSVKRRIAETDKALAGDEKKNE